MDSLGFLNRASIRSLIILSRVNHHYHSLCKWIILQKLDIQVLAEFTTIKQLDYMKPVVKNDNLHIGGFCEFDANDIIKELDFYQIYIEYIKIEFKIHNTYIINHKRIYDALLEFFNQAMNQSVYLIHDKNKIIIQKDINKQLEYNYQHGLSSQLYITGDLYNHPICIKIDDHNITCSSSSHSPIGVRADYEHLTMLLKDALMKNNMYYIAILIKNKPKNHYLSMLKRQLSKYQSTDFIKGYLGNYLKYLGQYKNDTIFNHLILDKRVKLNKYVRIDYVKDKVLYRFWLISHICQSIDYDNMIDVCKIYRKLL